MKNKDFPIIDETKYCICAMIDLLGFSSHLEVSGYDLRTSIGEQAIKRLDNLEKIIELIDSEKKNRSEYYPEDYKVQRINDAIFFTLDLDDILKPSIGNTFFNGISSKDESFITKEQMESYEGYISAYSSKTQNAIAPLLKFIGFISRIHISLNKMESQDFFPGAKTVISSGFRRPFKDDYFSANFSLSNAYIAEKSLHGPSLFIENAILHMISLDNSSRNLLRFAHFQFKTTSFDCFDNNDDIFDYLTEEATIPKPIEIKLFRKEYLFRDLNPSPLTHLQQISSLQNYLSNSDAPDLSNLYFKHIFNAIRIGISRKNNLISPPPQSFLYNGTNDLSNDIGIMKEFLSTGKSKTREELKEKKFKEEYSSLTEEGKRKMKELMDSTVEIEIPTIELEEIKSTLFSMNDEQFVAIIGIINGDFDELDYKEI